MCTIHPCSYFTHHKHINPPFPHSFPFPHLSPILPHSFPHLSPLARATFTLSALCNLHPLTAADKRSVLRQHTPQAGNDDECGTGLKLVSVESAKSQVVAGVNWSITLKAAVAPVARPLGRHRRASPPVTSTYVAEVFQSLTPVVGEPTVAAQRGDAAQPMGNGQPAVGGQPSGAAQPVLADYLVLVSFVKKK
ncbi:unnamed protein product [Closterium sp. Naga37s-1]|nr:unnamed protein product [Closterium sp. Naga37s-1]